MSDIKGNTNGIRSRVSLKNSSFRMNKSVNRVSFVILEMQDKNNKYKNSLDCIQNISEVGNYILMSYSTFPKIVRLNSRIKVSRLFFANRDILKVIIREKLSKLWEIILESNSRFFYFQMNVDILKMEKNFFFFRKLFFLKI